MILSYTKYYPVVSPGMKGSSKMNNNFSIVERNQIVEEHLWCIEKVLNENRQMIRAARLERDDVYQQLAERMVRSVRLYRPEVGSFTQFVLPQLRDELAAMKTPQAMYGLTMEPNEVYDGAVVSLDTLRRDAA